MNNNSGLSQEISWGHVKGTLQGRPSKAPHNGRHEPNKTHGKTPIHSRFTKIIISEISV